MTLEKGKKYRLPVKHIDSFNGRVYCVADYLGMDVRFMLNPHQSKKRILLFVSIKEKISMESHSLSKIIKVFYEIFMKPMVFTRLRYQILVVTKTLKPFIMNCQIIMD